MACMYWNSNKNNCNLDNKTCCSTQYAYHKCTKLLKVLYSKDQNPTIKKQLEVILKHFGKALDEDCSLIQKAFKTHGYDITPSEAWYILNEWYPHKQLPDGLEEIFEYTKDYLDQPKPEFIDW
jgi:hypothetical protein